VAEDLHGAADLLWKRWRRELSRGKPGPSKFSDRVPMMLAGMALEDLFKAIIVAQGGTPSTTHHYLVQLATDAGVKVSESERKFLGRISEFVMWFGKYPAPKPGMKRDTMVTYGSDWSELNLLYKRLSAAIYARPRTRRRGGTANSSRKP
jgi:hypothetical protein